MGTKRKATKKNCVGCRDDYYNHGNHSDTGECWRLKNAKMKKKYRIGWWVPMDSIDNFEEVRVPECYHQTGQFAYVDEIPRHLSRRVKIKGE